jgi:hypothetical protein
MVDVLMLTLHVLPPSLHADNREHSSARTVVWGQLVCVCQRHTGHKAAVHTTDTWCAALLEYLQALLLLCASVVYGVTARLNTSIDCCIWTQQS